MSSKPIIISIDGFASTGKSTLAKKISNYLEYNYVDTGSIYRAITLFSINNGFFEPDSIKLNLLKDSYFNSSLTEENDIEENTIEDKPVFTNQINSYMKSISRVNKAPRQS